MDGSLIVLLELALVFGLVAWFGYSQLRALRRDKDARRERARREEEEGR